MRVGDKQYGAPFVDYTNAKAAIEALTGLVGGETAYASDTGEQGYYDAVAASWVWGGDSNHNDLTGLQGGTSDEYYHLTAAQATDLTDSGDSTLHYHSADRNRANHTGTQGESSLALTDVTTNNATTSAHGFLPKLSGTATEYLDGSGAWSTPAGGGTANPRMVYASNLLGTISTTGETTVYSMTLPANFFAAGGKQLLASFIWRVETSTTARTLTLRSYFGSTTRVVSLSIPASTIYTGTINIYIVRTGANAQKMYVRREMANQATFAEFATLLYGDSPTETEAGTIATSFTLQLSGAVTGSDFGGVQVVEVADVDIY